MGKKCVLDLLHGQNPPQFLLDRSNFRPGQTARDNSFEVAEIGVHVEGQAVAGDPPSHSDTDRSDLPFSNPYPGPRRRPLGLETKVP